MLPPIAPQRRVTIARPIPLLTQFAAFAARVLNGKKIAA